MGSFLWPSVTGQESAQPTYFASRCLACLLACLLTTFPPFPLPLTAIPLTAIDEGPGQRTAAPQGLRVPRDSMRVDPRRQHAGFAAA